MYVIIYMKKNLQIWYIFFNTQPYNLSVKKISKFFRFIFRVMTNLSPCATGVTLWNTGLNLNRITGCLFFVFMEHKLKRYLKIYQISILSAYVPKKNLKSPWMYGMKTRNLQIICSLSFFHKKCSWPWSFYLCFFAFNPTQKW